MCNPPPGKRNLLPQRKLLPTARPHNLNLRPPDLYNMLCSAIFSKITHCSSIYRIELTRGMEFRFVYASSVTAKMARCFPSANTRTRAHTLFVFSAEIRRSRVQQPSQRPSDGLRTAGPVSATGSVRKSIFHYFVFFLLSSNEH